MKALLVLASAIISSAFVPFSNNIPKIASSSISKEQNLLSTTLSVAAADSDIASEASDLVPTAESASILPGQILSIRIGDTSNPRKAWKKRRRSGSPILVPCTIMGMNRGTMVKWNLMNLLHRFGKPEQNNSHNGVVLSVGAIVKLYKHRLGGDLLQHANALGYRTIVEFLRATCDDTLARDNGVQLTRIGENRELVLSSSLSLRLARESAYKAEFVQFQPSVQDKEHMVHVGTTFQLAKEEKYTTITDPDVVRSLSATVRISHADAEAGRFSEGMECNAFVHSYDPMGDNGWPLIVCAIDPPREQIRDQMKRRSYVKRQMTVQEKRMEKNAGFGGTGSSRDLNSLKVGDGPFTATVVKVSPRSGAAFVDLGVSRKKGKKAGGGTVKVVGMLRFDDIAEHMSEDDTSAEAALIEASILEGSDDEDDDEMEEEMTIEDLFMDDDGQEFEEDVSDVYSMDEDGNVSMVDPATGEKKIIGSVDSDDLDNDDDDDDDENMFAGMSPEERLRAIGEMLDVEEPKSEQASNKKTQIANAENQLKQGDKVDVYIRSVFPQSGRFMVTLDSTIKGKKMKDMKREKEANKRLEKLASKMGGEEGLENILSSVGLQIEGVVKAKSKTGDWYYVQPEVDGFPVGVAQSTIEQTLKPGDKAMVRVDGIDEKRGQLALTIMESL